MSSASDSVVENLAKFAQIQMNCVKLVFAIQLENAVIIYLLTNATLLTVTIKHAEIFVNWVTEPLLSVVVMFPETVILVQDTKIAVRNNVFLVLCKAA